MATVANTVRTKRERVDLLSGTPRAGFVDRWIYVFMAATFVVVVLVGFVPDSLMKIGMVKAGTRPPLPLAMHVHAVLMGSFLLLLVAQTVLVATGRCSLHRKLGMAAMVLAPALVLAGAVLAATNYHQAWETAQSGPPAMRAAMAARIPHLDNILLLQMRIGFLFPLFLAIGLRARGRDAGFHKRMMMIATAMPLPAAIDRMTWLPTTLPFSPVSTDLYVVLVLSPMIAWDAVRNRGVHRAYWVWLPIYVAASVVVRLLWDTPGWHATARHIMGV
ncbi:hypothetical protein ACUXST_002305 [Sphingomonas sp. F9_3S_D5_B_2]